ncbi:hypothetical protein B0J14DRAFT_566009 [Halenospora varia]|nr:hypothetical protein B0J14DRAFT_566009 [Halenospora varia]
MPRRPGGYTAFSTTGMDDQDRLENAYDGGHTVVIYDIVCDTQDGNFTDSSAFWIEILRTEYYTDRMYYYCLIHKPADDYGDKAPIEKLRCKRLATTPTPEWDESDVYRRQLAQNTPDDIAFHEFEHQWGWDGVSENYDFEIEFKLDLLDENSSPFVLVKPYGSNENVRGNRTKHFWWAKRREDFDHFVGLTGEEKEMLKDYQPLPQHLEEEETQSRESSEEENGRGQGVLTNTVH